MRTPSFTTSTVTSTTLLALTLLLGCRATTDAAASEADLALSHPELTDPRPLGEPPASARDRSISVQRGSGHPPHEVELDPRGEVALTLDKLGHVDLWPAIRSTDPGLVAPYELPLEQPLSMSVAQHGDDGGFVVAMIDTTNAGQVVALDPSADGQTAKLTPLFSIPPNDPLLELHALDGGERFLALGVDHRVRLYDRAGGLVSVIDQRSFAPWQLRVVPGPAGAPPVLAAVLAQPTRVQAIELRDDALAIHGEARVVELDRGPNLNDLVLGPDGKTVASLRRRSGRGADFNVELIDLETDARRLIGGRTGTTIRSRMHFVEPGRILLETGSPSGRGLWLDLVGATALADPADADPDSKLAKRLTKTKHESIPLVASAEVKPEWFEAEFDPPWDHGERFHASVVAGIRVNVERGAVVEGMNRQDRLVVDELASDHHRVFTPGVAAHPTRALDPSGTHVAGVEAGKLRIARVDAPDQTIAEIDLSLSLSLSASADPSPELDLDLDVHLDARTFMAFTDPGHVLIVDRDGALALIDWQAQAVVAQTQLAWPRQVDAIAYHADPDEPGTGTLGWKGSRSSQPAMLLPITRAQLGEAVLVADHQQRRWVDILGLNDGDAVALLGTEADVHELAVDSRDRVWSTKRHPRTPLWVHEGTETRKIRLPAGEAVALVPSPEASKLAVVQFRERDDSFFKDTLCSVFDAETGVRLWTLGFPHSITAPVWSQDGSRLIVESVVREAATGEAVVGAGGTPMQHEPSPSLVRIEDRTDADWARQPEPD